mgnify:CR=1 FL=1
MDKSRNYILDRLMSKTTTIEEFNYDSLVAPPLNYFLSPYDISKLNMIAKSLKLSAKPQLRYQEIDNVMRSRGLVKFAAGTNRVVYRHPEFPDILFKVAADAVGLGDNPAEYRNQFILRPFVTKCFEISPCGTVGLFERVNPITSREEFLSVADDVFELLNEWIIGKYVIADCGSKYFMNFGVRRGFGVVVLDYPYLYELDGQKLYCRKPDPTSQTGKCDGIIDYDDGYNHLHCTKCGAIYKAKELEAKIENNELVLERKGEQAMKITVSGGSKNIKKESFIVGEEFSNKAFKKPIASTHTSTNDSPKKKFDIDNDAEKERKKKISEDTPKKNTPINKSVNGVSTDVVAKSPVTFSEEYKQQCLKEKEKKNDDASIETFDEEGKVLKAIKLICEMDKSKVDTELMFRTLFQTLVKNFSSIDLFDHICNALLNLIDKFDDDDYVAALTSDKIKELFGRYFEIVSESTEAGNSTIVRSAIGLQFEADLNISERYTFAPTELEIENNHISMDNEDLSDDKNIVESDIRFYDGTVINTNEIYPGQASQEVIIPIDENGQYVTGKDDNIIAIDVVDGINMDKSRLVPDNWVKAVNKELDKLGIDLDDTVESEEDEDNEDCAVDKIEDLNEDAATEDNTVYSDVNNSDEPFNGMKIDIPDVEPPRPGFVQSGSTEMDESMKKFIESEINK